MISSLHTLSRSITPPIISHKNTTCFPCLQGHLPSVTAQNLCYGNCKHLRCKACFPRTQEWATLNHLETSNAEAYSKKTKKNWCIQKIFNKSIEVRTFLQSLPKICAMGIFTATTYVVRMSSHNPRVGHIHPLRNKQSRDIQQQKKTKKMYSIKASKKKTFFYTIG